MSDTSDAVALKNFLMFCCFWSTHPILSILLTHSTSGPPVVAEVNICLRVNHGKASPLILEIAQEFWP